MKLTKKVSKGTPSSLARFGSSLAVLAIAAALSGAPSAVWAQSSDATLRGTAPAGVTVVATDVNTGATRQTTAGADGTYVIAGLPSGSYHVTAGDSQADVSLSVASVAVYDFGAGKSADSGSTVVTVTGRRPTVEIRSSQVNQIVTQHDIQALPQATRNFMEFADTVPGVQFAVNSDHKTSLRGGAQLASAVNLYIDGVSQKDMVQGGSGISGTAGVSGDGDAGNPFPQLAVGEYKVVTSNYSAEFGDAASAVIIAQTKSGGNKFHGEIFGDFTNQDLRAKTPVEKSSGTEKGKEPNTEYGLAFSGPIIQDRMHFFVTWEHKDLSNQGVVYPGNGVTLSQAQSLLPSDVASQYGPVTNPFTENLYFGKIDYEPTANDRIEASLNYRIEDMLTGGSGLSAKSTQAPFNNDVKRSDINWQHSSDNWVNNVRLSYQDNRAVTTTDSAAPQFDYTYYPNAADPTNPSAGSVGLINVGGPGSGVGKISSQKGLTLADDLTFSNLQAAGNHTLKVGVSYSDIKLTSQDTSTDLNNATYYYAVTSSGVSANPIQVQFPSNYAGYTNIVKANDKLFSAYIQDNWDVNARLEINLGLRMDHEEVPSYSKYVTPSAVVSALNALHPNSTTLTYAQVLAIGAPGSPAININDYISTGSNRKTPSNFAPRLGFSYDLSGDGTRVLFGGYARAYSRNQFSTLALEDTKVGVNNNPQIYFPSAVTQDSFGACATTADINPAHHCYAWDPKYLTAAGLATLPVDAASHELDMLHNNIKTPYSDQFSLGIRNKMGDWNTQATLSYVESFDQIVGHFGNRYSDGAYFHGGSQWGAPGPSGFGALILWDNAGKDQITQLGLAGQKPYTKESGWSATVSYTYSDARQNNVAGGNNPYQIANNQYLFDWPDPKSIPMLRSSAVPKHRIVATYSRDLPWDMQIAGKLTLASPTSVMAIFCCSDVNPDNGAPTNFVSRAPNKAIGYKDVDLQLTKNFRLPTGAEGYARIDVINLFNWENDAQGSIYFPDANSTPRYTKGGPIDGLPLTVKLSTGVRF